MGNARWPIKEASKLKVGDVIRHEHLGWCRILEVQSDWEKQAGWVYFTAESHKEENHKRKCSTWFTTEFPVR